MTGETRRMQLLQLLQEQDTPISGTALAKAFSVSRQVIVQDIALMRAENRQILSTNKGYLYRREGSENTQPKRVFYVRHTTDQVLEEFMTVIELGGRILDVAVEHEIYGQIRVDLLIETAQDARSFAEKLSACRDNPLKVLTDDCHYHTVAAPSEKLLELIEAELQAKGYLCRGKPE
nr:transcription repressor NadR [Oscillospiraceae bacterium]